MDWTAIMRAVAAGYGTYAQNKVTKKMYRSARKTAELNAKLAEANFNRRSGYRNEELGQQIWNIAQQGQELMGVQRASMAASGFDISTGDQRILTDSLSRNLAKQSGVNRTYYLQQFEDEIQTNNDILQYNFEAYQARAMEKQYSGWAGAFKVAVAAGTQALGAYQPSGNKGGISSNTGVGSTVPYRNATSVASSSSQPWTSFGKF